jgi:hypothetical protein
MGGVGLFGGALTRPPASDFLSPISWLLGSLAPWLPGKKLSCMRNKFGGHAEIYPVN